MGLILNNVRWPEAVRVDNYAMVATTRFAENRVHEVLSRYGKDTVMACIREMLDRTERAVRAEIAAIPDGTYSGEAATDDDGTVLDQPVWVRLDITVKGDSLTVDFSRSDAQRKGFVNCPFAASYAIAVGSMMLLFDPGLADFHNEGRCGPSPSSLRPARRQPAISRDGRSGAGQCRPPDRHRRARGPFQSAARTGRWPPGASAAATTCLRWIPAAPSLMSAPPSTTTARRAP